MNNIQQQNHQQAFQQQKQQQQQQQQQLDPMLVQRQAVSVKQVLRKQLEKMT